MRQEYQRPSEIQLTYAQPLFELLFQEDNPRHVVTWLSLARNPALSFNSKSVIHHMIDNINHACEQYNLPYKVFCDPSGLRSLGLGLVDTHIDDLVQRLEEQSIEEISYYVANVSEDPFYQVDKWYLTIPTIPTMQFPNIHPVVAISPDRMPQVVYLRSENLQLMLRIFMENNGYIDRTFWPAELDYDYSIEYLRKILDTILPRKNKRPFIDRLRTAGYSIYGDKQRRLTRLRDALQSFHGQTILENINYECRQAYLREGDELVYVTLLPTHRLVHGDYALQISETYPYLVIITDNSNAFHPEYINEHSIIMEVTLFEYDLLKQFKSSLSYAVEGTKQEKNTQMLRFNNLLKRMKDFGYTFCPGTGIASKREQILPVPYITSEISM